MPVALVFPPAYERGAASIHINWTASKYEIIIMTNKAMTKKHCSHHLIDMLQKFMVDLQSYNNQSLDTLILNWISELSGRTRHHTAEKIFRTICVRVTTLNKG